MMADNKIFNLEKESIENNQTLPQEEIHVMSDYLNNKKLRKSRAIFTVNQPTGKKKKSFPFWLIWVIFGLIIISFAGIFYFYPNFIFSLMGGDQIKSPADNQLINNSTGQIFNNIVNQQPTLNSSPAQVISSEIKAGEQVVISAELSLPIGALSENEKISFDNQTFILDEGSRYQVIGGLFKISPIVSLNQSASLKFFYQEKFINPSWEDDIKIGYWQDGLWIVLPTEVNTGENILTTDISYLYSGIFGAIIAKEKTQPSLADIQEIAPGIFLAADQDNDSLTDEEEKIFGTTSNNPDSDQDGASDGQEIANLYSPVNNYGVKLADTEMIKIYSNQNFKYSIFHPSSFLPKPMIDTDESEVIISSNLGEFFSIFVQENSENLSAEQWYQRQINDFEKTLQKTKVDGREAVWSLDGLNLYVVDNDKIYTISYNIGGSTIAHLKATFLMMIRSFKFLD